MAGTAGSTASGIVGARLYAVLARVLLLGVPAVGLLAVACGPDAPAGPRATAGVHPPGGPTPAHGPSPIPGPEATHSPETTHSPQAAGAGTGSRAGASTPYCGPSRYVEEIIVQQWADGRFRVQVRPTPEGRRAGDRGQVAAEIWQAVQGCVTGLRGELADSLRDQLACHQNFAQLPALNGGKGFATGETYDLESWRPAPHPGGTRAWISTRCGNTLGTDPPGPPARIYRPDGVRPQRTVSGEQA
ncbi:MULTISPECIES: DUF2599 domain-containing protein [unclassified Frankia]